MSDKRPKISPDLERLVRQKCGFSCVMCGCPICDYDHIDNWADVKEHTLDNLTLLCTLHHRLKNKRILSSEVVRERTTNIQHKPNGNLPDINFKSCKLVLGNNIISGFPLVSFLNYERDYFIIDYDYKLKQILINAEFLDSNGGVDFKIEDNIYTYNNKYWDVESKGNSIIIKEGFRKRLLIITIDGINNQIIVYGKLFYKPDKYVLLDKNGIHLNRGNSISNASITNCKVGLIFSDWEEYRPRGTGYSISQTSFMQISDMFILGQEYGVAIDIHD